MVAIGHTTTIRKGDAVMKRILGTATALVFVLVLALAPAATAAQSFTAQVAGRVTDDSGGVLPGVTITAVNEETGVQRTVTTAESGAFQIIGLEPGRYTFTAELQGFAVFKQTGQTLSVNQAARLDVAMKVAGLQEAVTVTA